MPGPGANAISRGGQRSAAGAPYSTALADTNTAPSQLASAACARSSAAVSAGGRMTIAGKTTGTPPSAEIRRAKPAACRAGRVTRMPAPRSVEA